MKYILIILLLFSITASAQVKVGADGAIHATGAYPSAVERELKGYVLSVKGLAERNAIPSNFRDTGMIILVRDSSYLYSLVGGIANSNWQLFSSAGSISGGDTTVFNIVVDSTGQSAYRVLYGRGGNKIGSDPTFLYDSIHNKLVINTSNFSRGGNSTKLYVNGNTWFDGNQINRGNLTVTGTATISTTASGTAGTDSVLVQNNGLVKKISPTYYSTGGSTNSNIGSGYRLAVPNTNNIKTLHAGTNITIDSVSNANELTITASGGGGSGSVFDSLTFISAQDYGILPSNSEATNTTNATTALTFLETRGGGTLYFPFADSAYKVRLIIPAVASASNATHIRIMGANPPNWLIGTVTGSFTLPTKGVILKSASVTSGQAVISCTAASGDFSAVDLTCENLDIRTYNNPVISGIDASHAIQFNARNIWVNTDRYNVRATVPTTTTSIGIITPLINNGGNLRLETVQITGYYIGISANEHFDATSLYVFSCWKAVQIENSNLALHFGLLDLANNHYNIFSNGTARVKIDLATIEHAALTDSVAWQNTIYDLNDSLNRMIGVIFHHPLDNNFVKNGGTKVNCYNLDTSAFAQLGKNNVYYNGTDQAQYFNVLSNGTGSGFVWQTNGVNKYVLASNIGGTANLSLYDYTGGFARFYLDTTGKVRIGGDAGSTTAFAMQIDASKNINYTNGLGYWDATNGRLGIGTTTPSDLIHLKGAANGNNQILVESTSNGSAAQANTRVKNDVGDLTQLGIYGSGNTGYGSIAARTSYVYSSATGGLVLMVDANAGISFNTGTGAPAAQRMVISSAGAVRMNTYGAGAATFDASGNITSVSDERVKNIQGYFRTGLNAIMNLKPIEFKYNGLSGNETNGTYVGFSAQNVKANIPYSTGQNADGYLTLQDRAVMAAMVNAIQEQQKEIEDLRQEIKHLKRK